MTTDIAACIFHCIVCQKKKPLALPREEICWTDKGYVRLAGWSIDIIGPFSLDADSNRYLFIEVDPFL